MPVRTNSETKQLEYRPLHDYWDEALLPSGFPRRHWRKLFVDLGRLGFQQLSRRWQTGQQLIQSQGITYNVGNPSDSTEYSWPMDPIPLVISDTEWAAICRRLDFIRRELRGEAAAEPFLCARS